LLDDPLWASGSLYLWAEVERVLIPLLLDDPLWEIFSIMKITFEIVLIPLLLDDPLWGLANLSMEFAN